METYWVLTNQALTEVYLRVTPKIALDFTQLQSLVERVLVQPKVLGLSLRADLGADGYLITTQDHAGLSIFYEISWEPKDRLAAIQEQPEFLAAERRAETLVSLIAVLIWQQTGGHITDLHDRNIPADALLEAAGVGG